MIRRRVTDCPLTDQHDGSRDIVQELNDQSCDIVMEGDDPSCETLIIGS